MPVLPPRLRARLSRPVLAVVALLALGCDLPTSVPTWSTVWEVPARTASLDVGALLPDGVTVDASRTAFLFSGSRIEFHESLGGACGYACAAAQGATVPKPEFTSSFQATTFLPARIDSAQLEGGRINVRITNGLGFDPLRPGAAQRGGSLSLVITSGGREVARETLSGAQWALPANGGVIARDVPLAAGRVLREVEVQVSLYSPLGDAVRIDTAQRISVVATVDSTRIASASISVRDEEVGSTAVALDLDGVPDGAVNRVEGGSLILDVTNPFDVHSTSIGVDSTRAYIFADGRLIAKAFTISPGDNRVVLDFTADELRAILGSSSVDFDVHGYVSAADGGITVTPAQQIGIVSRLRLTLRSTER